MMLMPMHVPLFMHATNKSVRFFILLLVLTKILTTSICFSIIQYFSYLTVDYPSYFLYIYIYIYIVCRPDDISNEAKP
jgi:hypothetical protein